MLASNSNSGSLKQSWERNFHTCLSQFTELNNKQSQRQWLMISLWDALSADRAMLNSNSKQLCLSQYCININVPPNFFFLLSFAKLVVTAKSILFYHQFMKTLFKLKHVRLNCRCFYVMKLFLKFTKAEIQIINVLQHDHKNCELCIKWPKI